MAYATLTQLKQYLDVDETLVDEDTLMEACITRAQAHIEAVTRRVFESTSETRVYNALEDTDDELIRLYLDEDLISLTTATNGDGEDVTADCVLLPANATPKYAIELTDGVWVYEDTPHEAISIEGSWGYSEEPPDDIVQATVRLAAYLYKQRDAAAVDVASYYEGGVLSIPQGVPRYVTMVADHYRRRVLA